MDFERSLIDPVELAARAGASPVRRFETHGLASRLREFYAFPNRVAEHNARRMRDLLAARGKGATILVVGGGSAGSGARPLYDDPRLRLIAFDIYASPLTQMIADAHSIPLEDGSVDAVWVQAVLEHVLDPARVVAEMERVLVPDGLVYAETPFMQQVHEGAYDFTRFTESGHRWLFKRFERIDSGVVAGPGTHLAWTADYLGRDLFHSRTAGRLARALFFWTQWLDRIVPARFSVDDASCVYFLGRRWNRELTPREIVEHYQGAQRG